MKRSLNGGEKMHPLSASALAALRQLKSGPIPRQEFNPGVCDRLERGGLAEIVRRPSPYKTVKGDVAHLQITEAGLDADRRAPQP